MAQFPHSELRHCSMGTNHGHSFLSVFALWPDCGGIVELQPFPCLALDRTSAGQRCFPWSVGARPDSIFPIGRLSTVGLWRAHLARARQDRVPGMGNSGDYFRLCVAEEIHLPSGRNLPALSILHAWPILYFLPRSSVADRGKRCPREAAHRVRRLPALHAELHHFDLRSNLAL